MDYKTEMMENDHEEQLLPSIAKAVGVPVGMLREVGYMRDDAEVWFRGKPYEISFDELPSVAEDG